MNLYKATINYTDNSTLTTEINAVNQNTAFKTLIQRDWYHYSPMTSSPMESIEIQLQATDITA